MTDIDIISDQASALAAPVRVLALAPADASSTSGPRLLQPATDLPGLDEQALTRLAQDLGFQAGADEVLRLPAAGLPGGVGCPEGSVLLVGTGPAWDQAEDSGRDSAALGVTRLQVLRQAAGRAVRALADCPEACLLLPADTEAELAAVLEGALIGSYAWSGSSTTAPRPLGRVVVLSSLASSTQTTALLHRCQVLAEAVCLTRDLVNEPPNRLNPVTFTQRATELADSMGLEVLVRDEARLAAEGFGGILGVGQGSAVPPRLVRLGWQPADAGPGVPHVALIGKGITFDSGGLSLKPAGSMPEMKSDMAGAATVLAVVQAAARLRLPVRLTAWLALAENMPGAAAQRPSDIVTMVNGTTVEITNTDAEGRLVMADALSQAVSEAPDLVLDVATLTGAQEIALGSRVTGVMGTPVLRDQVVACAQEVGESAWPMPLPEDMRSRLDSPYADLRNADTGSRLGGMLLAGLFLREFVAGRTWAHLDIAGPAFNGEAPWGLSTTGGTGACVSTLLRLLERCTAPEAATAQDAR